MHTKSILLVGLHLPMMMMVSAVLIELGELRELWVQDNKIRRLSLVPSLAALRAPLLPPTAPSYSPRSTMNLPLTIGTLSA